MRGMERFPIHCLPSVFADYAKEVKESAALSDVSMPAAAILAVVSAAVGNVVHLRIRKGFNEAGMLWLACVARPGQAKSGVLRLTAAPLDEQEKHFRREYELARREYEAEERPDRPVRQSVVIRDSTLEALSRRLAASPRGVLYAADELTAVLGGYGRYGGGKAAVTEESRWLSIWSGETWSPERVTSEGAWVPMPFMSVVGFIQEQPVRELLGKTANGFSDRWLVEWPDQALRHTPPNQDGIDERVAEKYREAVRRLLDIELSFDENGDPKPLAAVMSPEATALWQGYWQWWVAVCEEFEEVEGFAAKHEKHRARLTLVARALRIAAGEAQGWEIDEQDVETGEMFLRHFLAVRLKLLGRLELPESVQRFVGWMDRRGLLSCSPRDVLTARKAKTADEAKELLKLAEECGIGYFANDGRFYRKEMYIGLEG